MGLVFGQSDKYLLVPEQHRSQIIPRAGHALKRNSEHLAVGRVTLKPDAPVYVVGNAPERAAHIGPVRFLSATRDTPIDFYCLAVIAANQPLPQGSPFKDGSMVEQLGRGVRPSGQCQ